MSVEMRIIAGKYRGRTLKSVPGRKTRPTAGRVREALFSVLGDTVAGARVLELYAGTGALSLEALSRGAREAVLVENDPAALAVLEANVSALAAAARVVPASALPALARLSERGEKFDLVLADPPYRTGEGGKLLASLERSAILAEDGVAVIEHPPEAEPDLPGPGWRLLRRKRYGRAVLSFYARSEH